MLLVTLMRRFVFLTLWITAESAGYDKEFGSLDSARNRLPIAFARSSCYKKVQCVRRRRSTLPNTESSNFASEKEARTLTYEQKGGNQSTADCNGVSLDAHIHALYGLTLQRPGKSVLMIGCGGGTLGTMLARAGKRVSIVEIDPVSFRLAKRYFGLPRNIVCHVGDGLAFMQRMRRPMMS